MNLRDRKEDGALYSKVTIILLYILTQFTLAAVHPTQTGYYHLSTTLLETNEVRV